MHASVIEKRLPDYLDKALACRQTDLKENNTLAIRLFNGFTEGNPDLVIDLYGKTRKKNPSHHQTCILFHGIF